VKRKPKATLREIVSDIKSSPPRNKQRRLPPGIHNGLLTDKKGLTYSPVERAVSPEDAVRFVKSGAQVIFDECGCGGVCGFMYVPEEELANFSKSKPILNSHKGLIGSLSLWQSESGEKVLLAEGPISWK
jgi:hypothetical protein